MKLFDELNEMLIYNGKNFIFLSYLYNNYVENKNNYSLNRFFAGHQWYNIQVQIYNYTKMNLKEEYDFNKCVIFVIGIGIKDIQNLNPFDIWPLSILNQKLKDIKIFPKILTETQELGNNVKGIETP